jgi:hypothetical protein
VLVLLIKADNQLISQFWSINQTASNMYLLRQNSGFLINRQKSLVPGLKIILRQRVEELPGYTDKFN